MVEEKHLQEIFLWRKTRRVSKLGAVTIEGREFETETFLKGRKVEVRFNPVDFNQVYIYLDAIKLQHLKSGE
ncbi:MAG: Mu transposase C-terminal domain-containing protein [bacterium]